MIARSLLKKDYDHIVQVIDRWSGGPTAVLAHPVFFHELGELARVAERDGNVIGFLLGFAIDGERRTGYIHLVGIHPEFRRRGVGRTLLESFESDCRARRCERLKSVAAPGNDTVISFLHSLGWTSTLVEDYAGPGRSRVVFSKSL